ncbi:MAG: S16 family serine protease [Actinomycetota bacterium]|nr:S16 family serine protease [Actinomycetota bacterium]
MKPGDNDDEAAGKLLAETAEESRRKGRFGGEPLVWLQLLAAFLIPLLFMFAAVPTGFLREGPGPAFDLQEELEVEGAETYPSDGELLLSSVRLEESRLFYHVAALFDDDFELAQVKDYLGEDLDVEEREVIDELDTRLSQDTATVVALEETEVPVEVEELGAMVVAVLEGYPADGVLDPGDIIVAVDGEPVANVMDAQDKLESSSPGQTVTLLVRSVGEEILDEEETEAVSLGSLATEEHEVELQTKWEPELDKAVIGVGFRDFFDYSSKVEVDWDLGSVKGPSAGMMMALSLVNALIPEDITGGRKVAGTGEIFIDGEVGPIGGLPMKIEAAESAGVEVFLYPLDNQEDLAGVSTSMELFAVWDLQQALDILNGL